MSRYHLDTDFLLHALGAQGAERQRLLELSDGGAVLEMSSIAWYEFCRGPRTPEQVAVARSFFAADGVVPFGEEAAALAASTFQLLGRPRQRAADVAIAATAMTLGAVLLTRNGRDFEGIDGLRLEQPASGA